MPLLNALVVLSKIEFASRRLGRYIRAMKLFMSVLVGVLLISGCATRYQARGIAGGFSETHLETNVFEVHFAGNSHTSTERARDFALLRACELTLRYGYRFYAIVSEDHTPVISAYTTGGRSSATASLSGNQPSYVASTTDAAPETHTMSTARCKLVIRCYPQRPENVEAHDARLEQTDLRDKYHIKASEKDQTR